MQASLYDHSQQLVRPIRQVQITLIRARLSVSLSPRILLSHQQQHTIRVPIISTLSHQ